LCATVSVHRDGKAAKRAGESENLPERKGTILADGVLPKDLEDKKGESPDRFIRSGDFFMHENKA